MLNPAVFLTGCLLLTGVGAWAFPAPAPPPSPPSPPPPPNRGRHLDHLFPAGQLSRMGRQRGLAMNIVHGNEKILDSVRDDPEELAGFHAHQYAIHTQQELIYYIMKRDEKFLSCMETEMGPSLDGRHELAFLFYAAEVCQRSDGRDFGIFYPRFEHYLTYWREDPRYSQANIDARVQEKAREQSSNNNAFQLSLSPQQQHLPPPSHGLGKMMIARLAATGRHWQKGVKRVPWAQMATKIETPFRTEPKALLLEAHE